MLADGRFVVAWTDNSHSGGDRQGRAVRGQIFDPREQGIFLSGTREGDDFVGTELRRLYGRTAAAADRLDGGGGNDTQIDGASAATWP